MENQRNCSSLADYEDIDNVHDCKMFALEAGHSFKGTVWSKYYPIGCYWLDRGNKMVYYNYHLTGGFQSDAIPVCINTKKGKSAPFYVTKIRAYILTNYKIYQTLLTMVNNPFVEIGLYIITLIDSV